MAARMRPDLVSTLVLAVVAVILAVIAYMKDPGLPLSAALALLGWRLVAVRVVPSLAFPVLAGWLVTIFSQE
jgi:hypothetical protein